jgi:hypothetical protein
LNQLATPGLGSLMAGRYVAGAGQLLLALAGFALVLGWFAMKCVAIYQVVAGDSEPKPYGWLGKWGAIIFMAAWLWSLVTSVSLLKAAKRLDEVAAKNPPPRIA